MFIKVKSIPCSKKEEIIKKDEDSFEIKIKEKPERGEANKRIKEILANYFKISLSKVILIKGAKQKSKIFSIKYE
ncbi:MAG TPA: DUF167 domain-containing protein [Candidatus Pacearchaeota archaeon]|nr:DUF167 domain-containing protein [Candidatus Parcubacteria bacterium]HNP79232.1 DUF167 domain-containing protein [Candidatus Pacearchaeota archaeon]HOC53486.1 DUF167 domain-containing protein [Candidatus Pacearchaeota archaeon]HQM24439.1 DUF167 domain-containing protein [Candidatus Pacearchaeota archaeon]